MTSSTSREDFNKVFPALVQDISEHAKQYNIPAPALEWLQKNLNENTPGGKLNRGLSVPDTALALLEKPLTEEQFKHLGLLGWMTELLQAFFLVSDDIMDSSITRRGEPCWYRRPGVGMIAINDAFMLESSIYVLLKKHFRSHPAYIDLVELFHETTFQTELGQLCDLITAPEDNVDLNNFNMDKFNFIVIYKTAYYSFYLPVALALHYLQLATPKNLRQAHDILIPLGQYFQAQDDYLDVFGKPEQIGKIGTDIQDNKCSWVVNQALKRCTPAQRKVLDECYGRKDAAMEAKVKAVFNEMNLQKVYHDFEEEQVSKLKSMIASIDASEGLKGSVFEIFLAKIYKRDK
ncbi:Farnesyl pyrophosphate synthetase [Trichophyton interdigitale]|uniref:Farnesyl pyrophosphate synthetase n=1 Tax=Trichophyton interdigitale TaxID=101480 RepID=A0A9P4YJ56_9EURO|nr:Farnesyl pyrophosphate synthetase [Trichophyton interdigitale]KAF3895166.1 Farnesyl pyrophosphate synthetase [Trichophyton interdigitale]KAG8210023.1 Farnesyl pyrophosphate synthetase [Trichophyton interdigitale]